MGTLFVSHFKSTIYIMRLARTLCYATNVRSWQNSGRSDSIENWLLLHQSGRLRINDERPFSAQGV